MAIILATYNDLDYYAIRRHGTTPNPQADGDICMGDRPEWHVDAACRGGVDGADWFPARPRGTRNRKAPTPEARRAREICHGCPVRNECLAWSLEQDTGLDGIWAGLDEPERRQYRRQHNLAVPNRPVRTGPGFGHNVNGWDKGCGCPTCHEAHNQRLEARRTARAQTDRKQKTKGRAA